MNNVDKQNQNYNEIKQIPEFDIDDVIKISNYSDINIVLYFFIFIIFSNFFILFILVYYQFKMIYYLLDKNPNKKFKKLNLVNNIFFIIYYIFSTFFIFAINSVQKDSIIGILKKPLYILHFILLLIKICCFIVSTIINNNEFSNREIIVVSIGDFIPFLSYLYNKDILFNK